MPPTTPHLTPRHWHKLQLGACLLFLLLILHPAPAYPLSISNKETAAFELAFDPGSAALSDEAKRALRQLADKLNTQHTEVLILTGHADAGEKAPQALGQQRARAVEQHLWHLGVNPWRIYLESKGNTQPRDPGQPARNRRVEVEAVSNRNALEPSLAGFSLMKQWMDDAAFRKPYRGDPGRALPSPHTLLPQVEPALRPRFLRLVQLVVIKDQEDSRLAALRALDDGSQPDGDPLPPALYAQVFGSPYARAATRREADRIPAADSRRVAFAQRLWCDWKQNKKPAIERVRAVLPAPEVLKDLADPEKLAWIHCALHSADALRWLRQQGAISLDVKRQPDGWTALHAAIVEGDERGFMSLMDAGADPRTTNNAGDTPLHMVTHPNHPLLPFALQKLFWDRLPLAGADRNAPDQRGQPARLRTQPLPPKDVRIADPWPPEVKRRVDTLLTLFRERSAAPDMQEIMVRLNVVLQELLPKDAFEAKGYANIYEVRANATAASSTPPAPRGNWWDYGPHYFISSPSANGAQMHAFTMVLTDADFCLNPYELAIYTGASFSDGIGYPSFSRDRSIPWLNEYAWDMFKRSSTDTYRAKEFHIKTRPVRDKTTQVVTDEGCVQTMGVTASFSN